MKAKIKFTKKQLREAKSAQAIVAKKAQAPDFDKSIPEAEMKVNRMKIY